MTITRTIRRILDQYESESPGVKRNLASILTHGRLGGTGRMVILPVDQGLEHGPARSFAPNPAAYDPHYHYDLAVRAGVNAYAAPLGQLEAGADTFAGAVPTILKVNSANSWATSKDQAITATVRDAARLGCAAIGFTIYPGSDRALDLIEEVREMAAEARALGLAVVIWSYPRGGNLSRAGETAVDVTAYAAHIAAQLGAHIIKVKPPTAHIEQPEAKKVYAAHGVDTSTLTARVRHVVQSSFAGRRLVVFSGGAAKDEKALYDDVSALRDGGAAGSIIGRNSFQRPHDEAVRLLGNICALYRGRDPS